MIQEQRNAIIIVSLFVPLPLREIATKKSDPTLDFLPHHQLSTPSKFFRIIPCRAINNHPSYCLSRIIHWSLESHISTSVLLHHGENNRQNRRPPHRHTLLLPRILPPQNSNGLLQPPRASRPHGARPPPPLRDRHLGRRWQHGRKVSRARGAVPARARSHDVLALDVYEYE